MRFLQSISIATVLVLVAVNSNANAPKVGKKAASKYFQTQNQVPSDNQEEKVYNRYPSDVESLSAEERFLALGLSNYTSTDSYNWGTSTKEESIGKWGVDMTYRISPYNNLMDQGIKVSYTEFEPVGKRASKLSLMYSLTLPDAGSKFPLYFGFAAGPGVFFKQIDGESQISLDYQLFFGLRLFNVFEKTGFYAEGGLKNHLHLTSDGQVNGTYFALGAIFTF